MFTRHLSMLAYLSRQTITTRINNFGNVGSSCFLQPLHQHQPNRSLRLWKERVLRHMYWRGKRFDCEPTLLRHRSEWQDWNLSAELFAFGQRLGGEMSQLSEHALLTALTHRSYVNKQQRQQTELGIANVARLESLHHNHELALRGQQIIRRFCSGYLRTHLPLAPEECIEAVQQYLLSDATLADIAKWIGCIDLVLCEELPPNEQTLASTVPALVASIESELHSLDMAHRFVVDFILSYLTGIDMLELWPLHELDINLNHYFAIQGESEVVPRIIYQSAVGTIEACYLVGLYQRSSGRLFGKGSGESVSIAKRMAELDAFRGLFGLRPEQIRLPFDATAHLVNSAHFDRRHFRLFDNTTKRSSSFCMSAALLH